MSNEPVKSLTPDGIKLHHVGFVVAGLGYLIAIRITGRQAQLPAAESQVAASS